MKTQEDIIHQILSDPRFKPAPKDTPYIHIDLCDTVIELLDMTGCVNEIQNLLRILNSYDINFYDINAAWISLYSQIDGVMKAPYTFTIQEAIDIGIDPVDLPDIIHPNTPNLYL